MNQTIRKNENRAKAKMKFWLTLVVIVVCFDQSSSSFPCKSTIPGDWKYPNVFSCDIKPY